MCGRGNARKNSATCSRFLQAILRNAISPQQRQYVQIVIVSLCKSMPTHQWCASNSSGHDQRLHVGNWNQHPTRRQDTIRRRTLHGFTLVELLVVIAIILVLASLALPAILSWRICVSDAMLVESAPAAIGFAALHRSKLALSAVSLEESHVMKL